MKNKIYIFTFFLIIFSLITYWEYNNSILGKWYIKNSGDEGYLEFYNNYGYFGITSNGIGLNKKELEIANKIKEQGGTRQDFIDVLYDLRKNKPELLETENNIEKKYFRYSTLDIITPKEIEFKIKGGGGNKGIYKVKNGNLILSYGYWGLIPKDFSGDKNIFVRGDFFDFFVNYINYRFLKK